VDEGTPLPQPGEIAAVREPQPVATSPAPQEAAQAEEPIGAANRVAQAREAAGRLGEEGAPESGIGIGYHESVAEGNQLIDNGTDPYKVASQFQTNGLINRKSMGVMRAWMERLQIDNVRAREALEADPGNPDLARVAQDAQDKENAFWRAYQPMKTEWSNIGTGMQESRGISDADLESPIRTEQAMREALGRELTDSDRARAARASADAVRANGESNAAFQRAVDTATRFAKGPPRDMATLARDLQNKLKEITC